jgi:ribonuclease P protein component
VKKSPQSKKSYSERLLSEQRIRDTGNFKFIFDHAVFVRGKALNVWTCRDLQKRFPGAGPKLGVIVSRKTSPSAVKRNLWKRRIRECFRKMQVNIKPDCMILVGSRQGEKKVPSLEQISAELHKLLLKTESLKSA